MHATSVTFVSRAGLEAGIGPRLGLRKRLEAVRGTRTVRKRDMGRTTRCRSWRSSRRRTRSGPRPAPHVRARDRAAARAAVLSVLKDRSACLHLKEIVAPSLLSRAEPVTTVTLTLDERRRSRLRVTLDDGREGAIFLPRGSALREGDLLRAHRERRRPTAKAVGPARARPRRRRVAVGRAHGRSAPAAARRLPPRQSARARRARVTAGSPTSTTNVLDDMVRGLGLAVETAHGALRARGRRVSSRRTRAHASPRRRARPHARRLPSPSLTSPWRCQRRR